MVTNQTDQPNIGLTATEVSNIWTSYLKNSMEQRLFEYFHSTIEDQDVKKVAEKMLAQSNKNLNELKILFVKDNLTIPYGFTEEDVTLSTGKVFSDTFILYFLHDLTMLSMSTYPSALTDCTRKDVRIFFQTCIEFSIAIQNEITDLMLSQGVFLKPPQLTIESEIAFVDNIKYINGSLGSSRPINVAEIANLSRIIHRAQFSKMVFVTFGKLATNKKVQNHCSKGRDEIVKVINSLQEVLVQENISLSASGDYQTYEVEMSPFSDRLMLFFLNTCLGMFCFTMISQAMISSMRSDIVLKVNTISKDMHKYYGLGLVLTIREGWLEQPPHAPDQKI